MESIEPIDRTNRSIDPADPSIEDRHEYQEMRTGYEGNTAFRSDLDNSPAAPIAHIVASPSHGAPQAIPVAKNYRRL